MTGLAGCLGGGGGTDDTPTPTEGGMTSTGTMGATATELSSVEFRMGSAFTSQVECLDCITVQGESNFKERLAEQSDGKLQLQLHSGGEICLEPSCLQKTMNGVIEMGECTVTNSTKFMPENSIWMLPYTYPTSTDLGYALAHQESWERWWLPLAEKYGVLPLWWAAPFFRQIYLGGSADVGDNPATPSAIKGLNIRRTFSEVGARSLQTWGARPQNVSYGDLFQALKSGVVDGYETGPGGVFALGTGLVKLTDHVIVNNFMPEMGTKWVNVEWLKSLPREHQETMAEVSRGIFEDTINMLPSVVENRWGYTASPPGDSAMAEFDVGVTTPTGSDLDQWRDPIDVEQNPDKWSGLIDTGEQLGGDGFYDFIRQTARSGDAPEPPNFEVDTWWGDYLDRL